MIPIDNPIVPLANVPNEETGETQEVVTILDEEVPLMALPKTGRTGSAAGVLFLLSGMFLAIDGLLKRKREN